MSLLLTDDKIKLNLTGTSNISIYPVFHRHLDADSVIEEFTVLSMIAADRSLSKYF